MSRNIEIKARVNQLEATRAIVETLADHPVKIIDQEDVFFNTGKGRLKLRFLSLTSGELISYQRNDELGPKTSTYHIATTDRPDELRNVLTDSLGETIIVKKRRFLYLVGRTRIHIDAVEGLGNFLELEVVLDDTDSIETGEAEARELMHKLGVSSDDLVEGAYADLLLAKMKK